MAKKGSGGSQHSKFERLDVVMVDMMNTTNGLCECGCGELAPIAKRNRKETGQVKGEPLRFILHHRPRGEASHFWKGGRAHVDRGYVRIYRPDHPYANSRGYVYEHRAVMEEALGRVLSPNETVHHRNGIRNDNRLENLELRFGNHGPGATHCPHCGQSITPEVQS